MAQMDCIDRNLLADLNQDGTYNYRLSDFDAANIHGKLQAICLQVAES
jgi:hypothetical protein